MQPLYDNLAVIRHQFDEADQSAQRIQKMLETEKLVISPLAFIRGRSLQRIFFIVDEAQNLTPHEVKTIITRAGEGTKIVFTGDIHQIDHAYLDSLSNGLSYLISRMVGQSLVRPRHVGERRTFRTGRSGERALLPTSRNPSRKMRRYQEIIFVKRQAESSEAERDDSYFSNNDKRWTGREKVSRDYVVRNALAHPAVQARGRTALRIRRGRLSARSARADGHVPQPHAAGFASHVRMSMDQFDDYSADGLSRPAGMARPHRRPLGNRSRLLPGLRTLGRTPTAIGRLSVRHRLGPSAAGRVPPAVTGPAIRWNSSGPISGCWPIRRKPAVRLPGSSRSFVKNETADAWRPELIKDEIGAALDRIAATGVAMELNTSGLNKTIPEMNPFPQMLVEMRRRSIPVVIGADAHRPERVGDGFLAALDLLEQCGYEHISFYVNRTRRDIPIATARQTLQPRPNVVIVLADDMGFSDAGCYGGEIATPNLDRLAAGGLRFTQFYNTGRCWPTRASLLSGYYAQQVRMDPPRGRLPEWTRLLPHRLRPAGYRSYHVGKWHVPGAPRPVADGGFDRSYRFDDWDRYFSPTKHWVDDVLAPPVLPGSGYYATTEFTDRVDRIPERTRRAARRRAVLPVPGVHRPALPAARLARRHRAYRTVVRSRLGGGAPASLRTNAHAGDRRLRSVSARADALAPLFPTPGARYARDRRGPICGAVARIDRPATTIPGHEDERCTRR
jgi:hypothetical protein